MKILITGTSKGIGRAIAIKFLNENHEVIGFDRLDSSIKHKNYTHYKIDIRDYEHYPNIKDVNILINNAGVQNEDDIDINLKATINITEFYGINPCIKSIINITSASAISGAEFPNYVASKGGLVSYTKNVALRIAKYNATCNSISPGGVITELNSHILENKDLWDEVMKETLIKKWATPEEIAEWVYFISVINKSMTAQDILIDNGEYAKSNFIW